MEYKYQLSKNERVVEEILEDEKGDIIHPLEHSYQDHDDGFRRGKISNLLPGSYIFFVKIEPKKRRRNDKTIRCIEQVFKVISGM